MYFSDHRAHNNVIMQVYIISTYPRLPHEDVYDKYYNNMQYLLF